MKTDADGWALMCYNVVKGKVATEFVYRDTFDSEKRESKLRDELLVKYFGSTKVVYPPL